MRRLAQALQFRSRGPLEATSPVALLLDDTRLELTDHLIELTAAWFPRTVDTQHGGFLCDFDHAWQPNGAHPKRLEYQARQTKAAAQAAMFDRRLRPAHEAAEHGFRYLAETMWDRRYGGWFYLLNRHGEPAYTEKHLHGVAYGIQACVEHHRLTGSAESIALAREAFDWLDAHAHDSTNGGYHPYLKQDGTPITGSSSLDTAPNPLATPPGLRDFNTLADLLDALADLYQATEDAQVGERVNELLSLMRDKVVQPPGLAYGLYTADWKPATDIVEIGLVLQASCILLKASQPAAAPVRVEVSEIAHAMLQTCRSSMWDGSAGGFYHRASVSNRGVAIRDSSKIWWVQAEGLRALMHHAFGEASGAANAFIKPCLDHWAYIDRNFVDLGDKSWSHAALAPERNKAYEWKDASHEVRVLTESIRLLGGHHHAAVPGAG